MLPFQRFLFGGAFLVLAGSGVAFANGPLASGTLEVRGTRLTIYSDDLTDDADQVVNVGERAQVRTCYGGADAACGEVSPGDPQIAGLEVRAELRGPELPQAVQLSTVPGGTFLVPGFQQEGDYVLENIRLINAETGAVLGAADPPVAVLLVRQILLASATVSTLSLEDLEARGIAITQENFQAFNFSVGFLFGTEIVTIDLPVLYLGGGGVQALDSPNVQLDGLPPDVAHVVSRWQPPNIVPFTLEIPEREILEAGEEVFAPITFPIFGAIVLPGNVSFLNQFFDATLIVANGAPPGFGVELADLMASLRLPDGNVLRVAETEPPVSPGQLVPMVAADGGHLVPAGEQAAASWTVEGLEPGTHVLQMDVTGELLRPGRDAVPVATRAQAAVEVVDARFHLTFAHPDVVREGTAYSLFVTIANRSRATQNLISVAIRDEHITGAHKADSGDDFIRTVETLAPGQSETVEYRLVADVTGKVVGGTFESSAPGADGSIQLYAGVGELGIPLSPATLVLPRFSERMATPHTVNDDYYRATMRFLGLAYSLAVVPAGMAPQGLPHVIRSDVEARAVDLGFAGQRTFLGEQLLESLEVLLLDSLGNREPLAEIDALRRATEKGLAASTELEGLIRHEQEVLGLDAHGLFDHFAETTSYARPYLAAMLLPGFAHDPPVLELRQLTDDGWTYLAGTSDDPDALRSMAFGEIIAVNEGSAGGRAVPVAVVGSVATDEHHEIYLHNLTDDPAEGRLLLIVADGDSGAYRRIDFGAVTIPPHTVYGITVGADVPDPVDGGFEMIDVATGDPVAGLTLHTDPVSLPPFRIIGARQDYGISGENRYGQGISYLFNRPPDAVTAEDPTSYLIRSTFDGLDTHGDPVTRVGEAHGVQAFLQPSERVVNVRYSSPLSALVDPADNGPLIDHEHLIDPLSIADVWGNPLSEPIPPPAIEDVPLHVGGLVEGRVLRGTGVPAAGARVQLIRPRLVGTLFSSGAVLDLVSEFVTGEDGAFYFDFVEQPHLDPFVRDEFILRAVVPEGADPATEPAGVEEVTSTIRQQNRLTTINIALLGRGTVTGDLVYLDTGDPVPDGTVTVASMLFNDTATVTVEADGTFEVPAMPVGPLTLTGRDPEGRVVYATVGIERPGDVVHTVLELARVQPPGLGTVVGTVLRQASGDPPPSPEPVAGATVEVYAGGSSLGRIETDSFGQFRFADVPAGQVTVQAADWRVSRTAVVADLLLAADQTAEITLTLPESQPRTVTGSVLFYDVTTNTYLPVAGAPAFISGPGVFGTTDSEGNYRIEGVPVQAAGAGPYQVSAIDYDRGLQGVVELPPVLDSSPDEIAAQPIVLEVMRGGLRGVVLDPLGRPLGSAKVVAVFEGVPYYEATSKPDGSFSFDDIPLGEWQVTAHIGDGLADGRVGYFGKSAKTSVVFGGHRPFLSVQMVGSGVVDLGVRSSSGSVYAEVYYRPTYYSETAKKITVKGVAIETQTDPNGYLQLVLPVGSFEITVFSPFHGIRTVSGSIRWAGQLRSIDVVFDGASVVTGQLVNVDGVTPIPDFQVTLHTSTLLPQNQTTDAEGRFLFELVPKGSLEVRAEGAVGLVERVGIAKGYLGSGGQTLELTVRMKAQGSVEGQVFERIGEDLVPLAHAQFYVRENSYPFRRLPAGNGWYGADADGRYQLAHVYAGEVSVVARDGNQVTRQGSARGAITGDWQVAQIPDIVLSTSVGSVAVVVRDPESGAPLPDTQVRIREIHNYTSELTVADGTGTAYFDALPLATYSVFAFHAPTGRSGQSHGIALSSAGQHVERTLYVDQRGSVSGTLYDDPGKTLPIPGGTVKLYGQTAGGPLTALDTTSGHVEDLGVFEFLGIPEGDYHLTAGVAGTPRRAGAEVSLTATAPVVMADLVLEPAGNVAFMVFESLVAGLGEVDLSATLLSVRLQQSSSFDFTLLQPTAPSPGHYYLFPGVLLERSGNLTVQELGGEQRRASAAASNFLGGVPLDGSGTTGDPYRVVLSPKGIVRVQVLDANGAPVSGSSVTVTSSGGGRFPSLTGDDGFVSFTAVPAGNLTATASAPLLGFGGRSTAVLVYDDDLIDMVVHLQPAVSAHGVIYQPVPGDVYNGDPSTLIPQQDAVVIFHDANGNVLVMTTAEDGAYHFDALPEGAFTVDAESQNGQAVASTSGVLVGPNGNDNTVPAMILDGGPPQILSIVPPPGMENVSRTATVEIVFSEPLLDAVLPHGEPTSPYFELRGPSGVAGGTWLSGFDAGGHQVVRFIPSQPYENQAFYSLRIKGGPTGVRDRAGRPLTPSGDVGSNFKTSDSVGPEVVGSEPDLDRPVEGRAPIRYDFNEALTATDEQLDGDGVDDAAVLSWGQDDGGGGVIWQPLVVSMFLTRSNYSLTVDPDDGLVLTGDTLLRRIQISGLVDGQGNLMALYERQYRVWDGNDPVIDDLPPPPGAPGGQLVPGTAYTVTPVLSGIDHFPLDPPEGDIDRVEYFFEDPTAPDGPELPNVTSTAPPYDFAFVAAYSGNGVDPKPFPVWARAVDTSTNESNVFQLDMEVLPNQGPSIAAVTAAALAPVPGVFYAGSSIQATVEGLADPDGTQLALAVQLWEDGGGLLAAAPILTVTRPASGDWVDLVPPTLELEIPAAQAEGAQLYLVAQATDSSGASVTAESQRFAVADDHGPPVIESIVVRSHPDGEPRSIFYIGEELVVEFVARDPETEVVGAEVIVDRSDIFPSPVAATRVSGDLFRTGVLTVPIDVFTEPTQVGLTVTADDLGGNNASKNLGFEVAPEPDPTAPTAEWLTPWESAAWPAAYTSILSPANGVALLLRVHARDLNLDANGDPVAGTIVDVLFRGPVEDGAGGLELAADAVSGLPVAGTEAPGEGIYELVWPVPNLIPVGTEIPFEVRVVDSGGLDVVRTVRMQAQAYRKVFEGAQTAVLADDSMLAAGGDEAGPVFLLDGTILSIYPQTDGSVRALAGAFLYAGGLEDASGITAHPSVLTAPEITSYSSPILFNPLELEVGQVLAVGAACRVDLSRRGLLGSTQDDAMVLPGESGAGPRAGGSHGGSGWFGAPNTGWVSTTWYSPSSSFDSIRDPHLPGAGGGGWDADAGGAGGGVVRLDAVDAVVRLVGDIRADGGSSAIGGGAGGAVRIVAGRLEGRGIIAANGGAASDPNRAGGGGGGRVALLYRELGGGVDLAVQVEALGGGNGGTYLAGGGTVYLEALDPATGESSGIGNLAVSTSAGLPAAATLLPALSDGTVVAVDPPARTLTINAPDWLGEVTGDWVVLEDEGGQLLALLPITSQSSAGAQVELGVFATEAELVALQSLIGTETVTAHGRARYAEVRATGSSRLAVDDDLEIGPPGDPAPALNDVAALILDANSRAALCGDGPTVELTPVTAVGTEVLVGTSVQATWIAGDPLGVFEIKEDWPPTGTAVTHLGSQPLTAQPTLNPVTFNVPVGTPPGEATLEVTARNVAGRSVVRTLSWTLVPDEVAPDISIELDPAADGDVYTAGTWVTVRVSAVDNVGVDFLSLTVDGVTTTSGGWQIEWDWMTPVVTESTPFDIIVEARDEAGNVATAVRTPTVEPSDNTGAPVVSILCPFDRDGCAPGSMVNVSFSITDDEQIESYVLVVDGAQVGDRVVVNLATIDGSVGWTPPLDAVAGASFTVMLEARDFGGNIGFAVVTLSVPEGIIHSGDQDITWGHEGEDLVLAAGTFTAVSGLMPDSLTLLNGALLTSPDLDTLEIATPGRVDIACGALIDVTGRGYPPDTSFPGAGLPSNGTGGGSHIGHGGIVSGKPGETYGSLTHPHEFGAGGSTRGGGVVIVEANILELDGAILAGGEVNWTYGTSGGAGGSVSITAQSVSGSGRVQANGSRGTGQYYWDAFGASGGGAIAVVADAIDPAVADALMTIPGEYGYGGGAGTVFLKRPDSIFGDLVVDRRNMVGGWTVLPALGAGGAASGSGGGVLVTDRTREVPDYFIGHWVRISNPSGAIKGTWRIEAVNGVTVTLEADADVAEGDLWQGVYRFDSVLVTGDARLYVKDLDDFGSVTVDPASELVLANRGGPVIDETLVHFLVGDTGYYYLRGGPGAVTDQDHPIRLGLMNLASGEEMVYTSAASDGSFSMSLGRSPPFHDPLRLDARDGHLDPQTSSLDLGPMPDLQPPVVVTNQIDAVIQNRQIEISGRPGAVKDNLGVAIAYLYSPANPTDQIMITVDPADGSFPAVVPSPGYGSQLHLVAEDLSSNVTDVDLQPILVNAGPPAINTIYVVRDLATGAYILESSSECSWIMFKRLGHEKDYIECNYPLHDEEGIFVVRVENRTTPGFGPFTVTVTPPAADCSYCEGANFLFDPVTIAGAVGDEIWLVAEDGHPEWQMAESLVWTLPLIPGAPTVTLGIDNLVYLGGDYHLVAAAGAVTDPDEPMNLEVVVWRPVGADWQEVSRASTSLVSADSLDMVLVGGTEGDLVVVEVTDSTGRATTVRVGALPAPNEVNVAFEFAAFTVDEGVGAASLLVILSQAAAAPVTVDYRTVADTATADVDYQNTTGTLSFAAGMTSQTLSVPILEDAEVEADETFQVELYAPSGVVLGIPATAEITIHDNEVALTVTYSVGVDAANMLPAAIGVEVVAGVATFAEALPQGPDRGDRVEIDVLGFVYLGTCTDDFTCLVKDAVGLPPADATGFATTIVPAFTSLEEALEGAADVNHLGTFDLVAANRNLEIVCYGGSADTTRVAIDGWITSPDHRIRVIAPTAAGQRSGSQRHEGRWSGQAYRLEVAGACISSTVGNLSLEGLQLYCFGNPAAPFHGVRLVGIEGDVEISETLIRLDGAAATAERIGIAASASGAAQLTVRNSMLWDLGDGSASGHVGILTDDANLVATIVNTTIVGGFSGIRSGVGAVTALNNLVVGATEICFDGTFAADSTANLASDATAPNPPANASGPVTVKGSTTGFEADLHLGCLVNDQGVTTSANFVSSNLHLAFDGRPETVVASEGVNPAKLRLVFDQPRTLTGTAVELSNCSTHDWMVAGADSEADLEGQTGSYRELVPSRGLVNTERAYEHIAFAASETMSVVELTVQRNCGGDWVNINEWWLDGTNPACGQGLALDSAAVDVDSVLRTGDWDVGADDHAGLEVFTWWPNPPHWWESEGAAKVQVLLSEPAQRPVTVRYLTADGTAVARQDYQHVEGELVFAPGEASKIISIPLIDDGAGDDNEEIWFWIGDPDGAWLNAGTWTPFRIRDDSPPPNRIRLTTPVLEVSEGDGFLAVEVEVDTPPASDLNFQLDTIDGSAHIVDDFSESAARPMVPAGQLTGSGLLTIVDDDIVEPDEVFYLRGSWTDYQHGLPVYGVVRIIDDDFPPAAFDTDALSVGETAGTVTVSISVAGDLFKPASVDVVLAGGTATPGDDFNFTPLRLDFDAIHRHRTVTFEVLPDAVAEGDETVELQLFNEQGVALGSPALVTITITDVPPTKRHAERHGGGR